MLSKQDVESRIQAMASQPDPRRRWDQVCYGSAQALVVFVGPSPGGQKETGPGERRADAEQALWNQVWDLPFANKNNWWSPGFRRNWKPLVEELFGMDYEVVGKLIALANFSWKQNPNSSDVQTTEMKRGERSVLKLIKCCCPQLVLPMDGKAFAALRDALQRDEFRICEIAAGTVSVRIPGKRDRRHRRILAFWATSPTRQRFLVMKLPQHPARMYSEDYGARSGKAIRQAALQIAQGAPVNVEIP